jgi:GNAT superfamily N-acetyltransferase
MNLDSHPGYRIESMSWDAFSPYFSAHRSVLFGETLTFRASEVMTDAERAAIDRLAENMGTPFNLNLALFYGDEFVGWSFGIQKDRESYYMTNSAILPEHRRKGLYTALMQHTVDRVQAEGFQIIFSRHTATNNAVIIPKLKFGFIISSLELSDVFGTLLQLRLYTNPIRRKMMDVRSGEGRPDAEMMATLNLSD